MRRTMAILAGLWMAGALAYASPEVYPIYIKLGTATASTQTLAGVKGYVDAVFVTVSGGACTGQVFVSYAPIDGVSAAVNIATNEVIGKKVWRPRVDGTDLLGADLTSDPPGRHALVGETVSFVVIGSPTNHTWRCNLVVDK